LILVFDVNHSVIGYLLQYENNYRLIGIGQNLNFGAYVSNITQNLFYFFRSCWGVLTY